MPLTLHLAVSALPWSLEVHIGVLHVTEVVSENADYVRNYTYTNRHGAIYSAHIGLGGVRKRRLCQELHMHESAWWTDVYHL